eukprot:scaffold72449_cov30-Tisochrysis_lutea.AAC.4
MWPPPPTTGKPLWALLESTPTRSPTSIRSLTVRTGRAITSRATRGSSAAGGMSSSIGNDISSIIESSNESEIRSPTALAMERESIIVGMRWTSSVISTRITAIVMVMRVMPPSTAVAPTSAMMPANPSAPAPGTFALASSSPASRPVSAPMMMPGTKLPAGTEMPMQTTARHA